MVERDDEAYRETLDEARRRTLDRLGYLNLVRQLLSEGRITPNQATDLADLYATNPREALERYFELQREIAQQREVRRDDELYQGIERRVEGWIRQIESQLRKYLKTPSPQYKEDLERTLEIVYHQVHELIQNVSRNRGINPEELRNFIRDKIERLREAAYVEGSLGFYEQRGTSTPYDIMLDIVNEELRSLDQYLGERFANPGFIKVTLATFKQSLEEAGNVEGAKKVENLMGAVEALRESGVGEAVRRGTSALIRRLFSRRRTGEEE